MENFIEELQDTNNDFRKEYQTMEREVGYMNDVLKDQNAELEKVSAFKDEKGISQLFKSYEEKELSYKNDVQRLEEQVSNLKINI